jgi:streptomycin 6-kinase
MSSLQSSPDRIPDYTAASLHTDLGVAAHTWIDNYPELLAEVHTRYEFTAYLALGGSRGVCLLGTDSQGRPVAVKLSPYRSGLIREAEALLCWADSGVVPTVHEIDPELGMLVLERILPGTPLGFPDTPGPSASPAAVQHTLSALRTTTPPDLSHFKAEDEAVLTHRWDLMQHRLVHDPAWVGFGPLVEWSYTTALKLHHEAIAAGPVLIHGDFQPKNLLSGPYGLVIAIDPLAGLGDPCFDAALWAVTDLSAAPIEHTLTQLTEQGELSLQRCIDWAVLVSVFEYRPSRRRQLAARIEEFLDTQVEKITATAAARAWAARPTRG